MARRSGGSGHPGRRKGHRSGVSGHPGRRAASEHRGGPLDLETQAALLVQTEDRLGLLQKASGLLSVLDPRDDDPFHPSTEPRTSLVDLLRSFVAAGPDLAALGWAMAVLSGDPTARSTVLTELLAYGDRLPDWVDRLDEIQVVRAVQTLDTLRDTADVVVEARLGGITFTVVTLVDFNLGAVVKDAFAREITLAQFEERWTELSESGGGELAPLNLADARTRLEEAVQHGAMTWPPMESEEWPQTRALVEWVARQLPAGGSDFDRPRLSERRRATLARRFFESAFAPEPPAPDDEAIVDDLLWYRSDYGFGDPLRWSPPAVEILLLDWYPRKIVADDAYLARMPDVLRLLVRFAHERAKVPRDLTAGTLAAIETYEPEYRDAVSRPRAQGVQALFERMGLRAPDEAPEAAVEAPTLRQLVVDELGGEHALAALDDQPLPDEPFRWEGVPSELRDAVTTVVTLSDEACDALLDVEQRTAARRLLRDLVELRPLVFTRGSPVTLAAGVVSLVDRANQASGRVRGDVLLAHFGLKGLPSTRLDTIRSALGSRFASLLEPLGSVRYLAGAQRRWLLDLAAAEDEDDEGPAERGGRQP